VVGRGDRRRRGRARAARGRRPPVDRRRDRLRTPVVRGTERGRGGPARIELVATYLAVDGVLQDGVPAEHRALWAIAAGVIPPDELAEIRQLNVVTDGANGTLGMVHRSGLVADRWILSMDATESPAVLEETLIHELGHILTLRRADLRAEGGACEGVQLDIGCALPGSALAEWATGRLATTTTTS
jgi:hypothetical protein